VLILIEIAVYMKKILTESNAFYPAYLKAHNNKGNQALHFIGASLFFACIAIAFTTTHYYFIAIAIAIGYILPGIGHRFFQHNDSFRASKPILCVICATKLYWHTLTFQLNKMQNKNF
jgi:hypothetical protein